MSGRRIDDHSFFAGKAGKDMVLPQGVHTKAEKSAEGAGELKPGQYGDTTELIHERQEQSMRKAKAHPTKHLYRN